MSNEIDQRVVEMSFDNRQFEKGAKESIDTLEKLDKSLKLDKSARSLEDLGRSANNMNMNGLANTLEMIGGRFTNLGIVATDALIRITRRAEDMAVSLVKSVSVDQISAGFSKYEDKVASVQTIMAATGKTVDEVSKSLEKLNWFTDETSYDFVDMVNNIGKFTSAGVDLEVAVSAMEGIATEAALSGQNAQTASRAMFNFSQALSAGAVKSRDWLSIELANMATAEFKQTIIDTAVELGTLRETTDGYVTTAGNAAVSVNDFNSELSRGWFSSEVLVSALGKYANYADAVYEVADSYDTCADAMAHVSSEGMELGAKAFKAAQEAKTWTDAINATKDAVSTGWMNTFELIIGDYEEARVLWTDVANEMWEVFASGGDKRNELLDEVLSTNHAIKEMDWRAIEAAGFATEDFQKVVIDAAKRNNIAIDDIIESYGSFRKSLEDGWLTTDILEDAIDNLDLSLETTADSFVDLESIAKRVLTGEFGNGADRVKKLTEAGYDYSAVQQVVNALINGAEIDYESLNSEQLTNLGYTEEQIAALRELKAAAQDENSVFRKTIAQYKKPAGRVLLIESISNAYNYLKSILVAVRQAWDEVFPPATAKQLYNILERVHAFTETLTINEEVAKKITATFKDFFGVLNVIVEVIKNFAQTSLDVLVYLFERLNIDILDIGYNIGETLAKMTEWMTKNNRIAKAFDKLGSVLKAIINIVATLVEEFFALPEVQAALQQIETWLNNIGTAIGEFVENGVDGLDEFLSKIEELGSESSILPKLVDFFNNAAGSVKNFVSTFTDGTGFSIDKMGEAVSELVNNIMTALGIVGDGEEGVSDALANIESMFLGWKTKITRAFQEPFTALFQFLGDVGSTIGENMGDIMVVGVGGGLLKLIFTLLGFVASMTLLVEAVAGIIGGLKAAITRISKAISFFVKMVGVKNFISALKDLAASILMLAIALAVVALIPSDKIDQAINVVTGLVISLVGLMALMTILTSYFKSTKLDYVMNGALFVALSVSLLLMAAAVKVIAGVPTTDLLDKIAILVGILAALLIVAYMMNRFQLTIMMDWKVLIGMAGALFLIAAAMHLIASVDINSMYAVLPVMVALLIVFSAVLRAAPIASSGGGTLLLGAAIALIAVIGAIKLLSMIPVDKVVTALGAIAFVFILFAGLLAASAIAGKNAARAGVMLIGLGASLILISGAMAILSRIPAEDMERSINGISSILKLMIPMLVASVAAGKNAHKAGVMLIALGAALVLIALSMHMIAALTPNEIESAMSVIERLMIGIGALLGISAFSKGESVSIMSMVAALGVLIGGLALISLIPDQNAVREAAYSIAIIVAALGAMMLGMSEIDNKKLPKITQFAGMIALVGIAAVAVALLAKSSPENVISSAIGLGVLLIALTSAIKILDGAKPVSAGVIGNVGLLAAVVIGIAWAIKVLKDVDPANAIGAAVALGLLINALSASVLILSNAKGLSNDTYAALAVMVVIVGLLGVLVGLIANSISDVGKYVGVAVTLGTLILALSAACILLGIAGAGKDAALWGAGALVAVIAAIGTILAALGAIDKYTDGAFSDILDRGIPMLLKIGQGLGEFVGIVIASVGAGISDVLPLIGDNIHKFLENVGVDSDVLTGVENAAAAILIFAGASFLETLLSFADALAAPFNLIGTINEQFEAEKWKLLAQNIVDFSNEFKNVDSAELDKALMAAETFTAFNDSLPTTGGLSGLITGNVDWDAFANGITNLGDGIVSFSNAVKADGGIDIEAVKTAAEAARYLSTFEANMPKHNGVLQDWIGDTNIADFGQQLGALADGLVGFSNAVTENGGLNTEAISNAATAAGALSDFESSLPSHGGILQDWLGDSTLDSFGEELMKFASGLISFCSVIQYANIDQGAVDRSVAAASALAGLENSLPAHGGVLNAWLGDSTLESFGGDLKTFGEALVEYGDSVSNLKTEHLDDVNTTITNLANITNVINENDANALNTFVSNLPTLGLNLSNFYAYLENIDGDKLADIGLGLYRIATAAKSANGVTSDAISGLVGGVANALTSVDYAKLHSAGADYSANIISGFTGNLNDATDAGQQMGNAILRGTSGLGDSFEKAGRDATSKFNLGVRAQAIKASPSAGEAIGRNVKTGADSFKPQFQTLGFDFVNAFIRGINKSIPAAKLAGRTLAAATLAAAKEQFNKNKPKVEETGESTANNLAEGMNSYASVVGDAAYQLGEDSLNMMREAIQTASDIISGTVDLDPTIRPVLDLSNVENGIAYLNRNMMGFGMTGTANVAATIGQVRNVGSIAAIASNNQNGISEDTRELIRAVDRLSDLASAPRNTYNVGGITYDDGTNVAEAVGSLARALRIERRA